MNTTERSYKAHEEALQRTLKESGEGLIGGFESYEETLDAWRHQRMMAPFQPIAEKEKGSWITIGDGKGWDAARLHRLGVDNVTATDLHTGLLEISKKKGLIGDFRAENAESLSSRDNSVDIVFCKESFHHFPRPYIGLYEMLRVARKAVLLIEPRDYLLDHGPVRFTGPIGMIKGLWTWAQNRLNLQMKDCSLASRFLLGDNPHYEESGNYMYSISSREIEKVSLGLNLPSLALKGVNDHFEPGLVHHAAKERVPEFQNLKKSFDDADRRNRAGIGSSSLLLAIIFKETPSDDLRTHLEEYGWYIKDLARNPYMSEQGAAEQPATSP